MSYSDVQIVCIKEYLVYFEKKYTQRNKIS